MYLLDTPVIAELRNARAGRADPGVTSWASGVALPNLFISALSLLELESGIAQAARKDQTLGIVLRTWIDDQVMTAFEGRILAVDTAVVRRRGALASHEPRGDRDALLAATALVHGLTLVTRTPNAFRNTKVKLFNPWGYSPEADDAPDDWQQATQSGPLWLKNLFLRF